MRSLADCFNRARGVPKFCGVLNLWGGFSAVAGAGNGAVGVGVARLLARFGGHPAPELRKVVEGSGGLEGFGQHQEDYPDGGAVVGVPPSSATLWASATERRPVLPLAQLLWPR